MKSKRNPANGSQATAAAILGFLETTLAHERRKKAGDRLDPGQDSIAFAVGAVMRELVARGMPLELGNPATVSFIWRRLAEYRIARLRWHLMLLKKECPEVLHPHKERSDAAFVGYLLSEGKRQAENPRVQKWLAESKTASPIAYRAFQRWLANPKPARWKHPELDSWLTLVWSLVEEEAWNYSVVFSLAGQKFIDSEPDAIPFRNADILGAHCKLVLGLKIKSPEGGRPLNDQIDFDNPSPLHRCALSVDSSLPGDSHYRK